MNTDMDENHRRIVVDSNVLISDIIFGGKPRIITRLIIEHLVSAFTSPDLIAELLRVLKQKFLLSTKELRFIESKIRNNFKVIYPMQKLKILKDEPDNRVLEVAVAGKCHYIVTGDKELLALKKYKDINIVTPDEYLTL